MSDAILNVTSSNFETEVLKSDLPVIVDFWAIWCGPCRALTPALEAMAKDYDGKLKVCKVDITDSAALADQYRVQSIPCVIAIKNGKEAGRVVGNMPKQIRDLAETVIQ